MKTVAIGKNHRLTDVPENWAEAEKMINLALRGNGRRGYNNTVNGVCARIAFGLLSNQELTPDPTTALAYVFQRICICKGAGLERK